MPTQEEVDQVVQELATYAQQPAESVVPTTRADGTIQIDLGTNTGGVVLARPNGDGTFETRCVFTLCTSSDLIAALAATSTNHGSFVSGIAHLTNEWRAEGIISGREKGTIQSAAARSN
jgi:hypothetical protein